MDEITLSMIVGAVVIITVVLLAAWLGKSPGEAAEQRLEQLTGGAARKTGKENLSRGILLRPDAIDVSGMRDWLPRIEGLARLYEQADVGLDFRQFLAIPAVLVLVGTAMGLALGLAPAAVALGAAALGGLPLLWLVMRKRRRIKQFVTQMPDALELVGRALRAGHGIASGMRVVADEMAAPIADEFGRVFEEQNLGIPLEDAMRGMAERVPLMEVRFFVTAVVIQRSSGGDLAEVLDKIGRLIRERFQVLGQVQALTAEGRLSGMLLLALPPGLLAMISVINPEYAEPLFTTPAGTKMLAAAAVLQGLGAVAIKKIVSIKV